MKKFILLCMFAAPLTAQVPANTTLVGSEGITVTACTVSPCTYYFGAGSTYYVVTSLKLPAAINCASGYASACAALGGDPAPGVSKSLYVAQQAAAGSVTYIASGSTTPVVKAVPALPPVVPTVTATYTCPSVTFSPTVYVLSNGVTLVTSPGVTLANCTAVTP
jgi:hypothetical protein